MTALALPLLLIAAPAGAVDLVAAAARVRVGDAAGALGALEGPVPKRVDDRAVVAVLRARASLLSRDGAAADVALQGARAAGEAGLVEVVEWLTLQAARARDDAPAIVAAADAVLARPEAPARFRDEATLSRAEAQGVAGLPALQGLADHRVLGPRALEGIATLGDGLTRAAALRRLLVEHPDTPPGRRAAERLDPSTLDPDDQRTRAKTLFAQRAYDLAEEAYARIVADERQTPEARQRARLDQAITRMRLREHYDEALRLLDEAAEGPERGLADEAVYRRALVLGNLARWDDARAAMRAYLARAPKGPYAVEAAYQVGRLAHQGGRYAEAVVDLTAFLAVRRPDHAKYAWFLGWAQFRAGDCPAARAAWADMLDRRNLLEGPKARYWTARCLAKEGNPKAARRALDGLAAQDALSYYGLLGAALRAKLDGKRVVLPARPAGWPRRPPRAADLRAAERRLGKRAAPLRRVRLLVAAGYPDLAREVELPSLRRALGRAGERRLRADLDVLLERFSSAWAGQARRRVPWNVGLSRLPRGEAEAAYPPAWLPLTQAAGGPHDVSSWWLLSHALQESRFKPRAASHAGALGALQILPRTGRLIAARLGFPAGDFFDDALFEPGVALRQAAWYLDALRTEFGGVPLLAAAAYNGGPRRVAEHLATVGDVPFDVAIEEIGAHETRNYVRKIGDHVVRNATLWAPDAEREALLRAWLPPETTPVPRGEVRF